MKRRNLCFWKFDRNTSTICALDSTDNIQQGGFTGARRPQKYTEFPFFNIQVQPFQNIYFAVPGGIENADGGSISIEGEKLADMKEKKLSQYRRKHLGYIFQMYNLIPNLTVRENIEVGAYLSDRALDVDELLHTLGLFEHQRKLPNQLSGGQQQRTAIGRAIVKNPDILLCDEPTGALDYNTSKEILKLIETVNQKYGNTVIMVTHNDAIKDMADRVVKLRDGMIRKNYQNEHKIPAMDLDW